ncbi:hypothetical protein F8388_003522 [Cannabis sativa]|uniref:Uncharacterized protein n=1 Tax=Cannabis sativa TaxID=3483 RepID=A0A7J6EP71_CANSA|nr:hypothetical protein F8388_003522 [Cannabis sativa]
MIGNSYQMVSELVDSLGQRVMESRLEFQQAPNQLKMMKSALEAMIDPIMERLDLIIDRIQKSKEARNTNDKAAKVETMVISNVKLVSSAVPTKHHELVCHESSPKPSRGPLAMEKKEIDPLPEVKEMSLLGGKHQRTPPFQHLPEEPKLRCGREESEPHRVLRSHMEIVRLGGEPPPSSMVVDQKRVEQLRLGYNRNGNPSSGNRTILYNGGRKEMSSEHSRCAPESEREETYGSVQEKNLNFDREDGDEDDVVRHGIEQPVNLLKSPTKMAKRGEQHLVVISVVESPVKKGNRRGLIPSGSDLVFLVEPPEKMKSWDYSLHRSIILMEENHKDDKTLDNPRPFSVLLMPCSLLIFKDSAYSGDYLHGIKDSELQSFNGVVNEVEALNYQEQDSEEVKNIHRTSNRISLTCRLVLKVHKNLFKF